MTATKEELAEGRFYLGKDGKVVRQVDFLWNSELVSYREFDPEKGHPIRFHQTCHTKAFLGWMGRSMHPSETGYFQVAEADRLQEIESERRWKQVLEHIPEERLVGELGRRGYRVEAPQKPHPLARMLTVHFQVKDGNFEKVGPMSDEDRIRIVKEMRDEATRQGPLGTAALVQPLLMSMGGKLFDIDDRMCVLYFSLVRSGPSTTLEHLLVESASSPDISPLSTELVSRLVRLVFGTEEGVLEVPAMKRPGTARQFIRVAVNNPTTTEEPKQEQAKRRRTKTKE